MIYSQYFLGAPFVAAIGLAAMNFVEETIDPGPGIVVHSLIFSNDPTPQIIQDRTVYAQNKIIATWSAKITAAGAEACDGAGSWGYPAGHKTPAMGVDEWVGESGCWGRLPVDVTLQACAVYEWGDGQRTEACSLGFRKVEDNG